MAFDKAKVVRAAEKYLSQGNITAAIKEYSQLIEQDPDDFTTLNMLGDLYVRAGQKPQAAGCFARIAEHYREQGFVLKAIAMFKKLDRMSPGQTETAYTLATLYDMQGLNVEARTQYLIVAEAYTREGHAQKALEVLRKVADLDPNNTEVRLRLAEGYLREGLADEAVRAFTEAGTQFHAQRADWKALQAYQSALKLRPADIPALQGLVHSHITLGTADDAAEVVERALVQEPDNVEMLRLLAQAYFEAQDAPAAERVTNTLVEQKAASYESFVEVARLYLKVSDTEAAVRVLTSITEQMLTGREEGQLLQLLDEALMRDPEQVNALRLLARIHAWRRDDENLRGVLERLLEAAEASDFVQDQRYALEQLVRIAPDQTNYIDRLQALGGTQLLGASQEESWPEPSGTEVEVPTFESFTFNNQESALESEPASVPETPDGFGMFEGNGPATANSSFSFADLNEWTDEGAQAANAPSEQAFSAQAFSAESFSAESQVIEPLAAQTPEPSGFQEIVYNDQLLNENLAPLLEKGIEPVAPEIDPRREAMRQQELESIDFYIAQGYTDIALDTLEILERQFGPHPDIDARLERLVKPTPGSAPAPPAPSRESATEEVIEVNNFARYDASEAPSSAEAVAVEIDDVFARIEPARPAAVVAHVAAGNSPATQPATQPVTQPVNGSSSSSVHGLDAGLAAIFDEYRTAVEQEEPPTSEEDYETHYNLGLAYKEMDLVDEAVEEFQVASTLCAPQDGTPRYLQCCNLLGHCFMQKGIPRLAVMWFKKGLDARGHTEDEYQALRYELGMAYERLGDIERAIETFTEVYGISVSYRGVTDKLRELEAQRTTH
jgi:tetratricopeptide (TPR) repeat protein